MTSVVKRTTAWFTRRLRTDSPCNGFTFDTGAKCIAYAIQCIAFVSLAGCTQSTDSVDWDRLDYVEMTCGNGHGALPGCKANGDLSIVLSGLSRNGHR